MKHIILPTDFNILSLQPIHDVMELYKNETLRITALHLVTTPTGIGDLLFRVNRIRERFPVPASFLEACEVLANRYKHRISGIAPMIRYGTTATYLDNLLNGINADAIAMPKGYIESLPFEQSVPLIPLIKRCSHKVIETPITRSRLNIISAATVGDLLLNAS